MGRYPNRASTGVTPSVELTWSLCTADATVSHRLQSPCCAFATRRRYCSTHWFFRSESPSVRGWNAVDRFCLAPILLASARPKWDVKRGSLSEMIFDGSPNHRNTLSKYSWATPGPVIVVAQGRKTAAREHPWCHRRLVSVEIERAVVVREQQGDNVEPNPESEGCYES